jgi:hypothetical protein
MNEEEEARRLSCDGQRWRRPGRSVLGGRDRLAERQQQGPRPAILCVFRTTVRAAVEHGAEEKLVVRRSQAGFSVRETAVFCRAGSALEGWPSPLAPIRRW